MHLGVSLATNHERVDLAGVTVDLLDLDDAVERIVERAAMPRLGLTAPPLSVVSANLDHVAQFGRTGRWHDTLDYGLGADFLDPATGWLTLLDGAPLVAEASRLTGRPWPRLAGSDLIGPLLDAAEERGITVGFLGGSYVVQRLLSRRLTRSRPDLQIGGMWSPDRSVLSNHEASLELARVIAASGTQLLVVGLGKPRQELWMAKYGPETGANVLLAFGAVVDFLAGSVQRAPRWASENGLEWAWRLALEPRRLARRYLVDDPPSLLELRRHSRLQPAGGAAGPAPAPGQAGPAAADGAVQPTGRFVGRDEYADVVVCVVTYNSREAVAPLIGGLRREAQDLRLRVVVADNASSDGTLEALAGEPGVIAFGTGGNLGYAAALNAAAALAGNSGAVLVLNPDLVVEPGSIRALHQRLRRSRAGAVVPRLLNSDGSLYQSLRREPSVAAAFGDALFGARFPARPGWLAETDYDAESYEHPHRIDWATGAALMVRTDLAERLGPWDERFFLYSEEVDYFRRIREAGESAWYEPSAHMVHHMGGSGTSTELAALMAVNRIRYVRKYHDARYAAWFGRAVALNEALRCYQPDRAKVLGLLRDERRWETLPGPTSAGDGAVDDGFPAGAVIIPAHNEESVIGRTLQALAPVAATGRVEVIVACNGCTDTTARIARGFAGVRVLEVTEASKVAALNAADAAATLWPRVYLDADIEIPPVALRMVLDRLASGGPLAARPAFAYDDGGAEPLVRAFYRARRRLPSTGQALWGAGVYGLAEAGHRRFGAFPEVTGDDLFVDLAFSAAEKAVVGTPPVTVRTPRTARALLGVLRRYYRGQAELVGAGPVPASLGAGGFGTRRTLRELLGSVRGPFSALDAAAYAGFVVAARVPHRGARRGAAGRGRWERDESSRTGLGEGAPA